MNNPNSLELIDIANELTIIPRATMDVLLSYKNPSDLIALYSFYYYTAKWQKTNQPFCTVGYIAKKIHWGKERVIKSRNILKEIGLIEDVVRKNEKTKKITGYYVNIRYILRNNTVKNTVNQYSCGSESLCPAEPVSGKEDTYASSNNNNALSSNNNIYCGNEISGSKEPSSISTIPPLPSEPNGYSNIPPKEECVAQGLEPSERGLEALSQQQSSRVVTNHVAGRDGVGGVVDKKKNKVLNKKEKKDKKKSEFENKVKYLNDRFFIPEEKRISPEKEFDSQGYKEYLANREETPRSKMGMIVGEYFGYKQKEFNTAEIALFEFERALKAAAQLRIYPMEAIIKTLEFLSEADFYQNVQWTLETVINKISEPDVVSGEWRNKEKKKNNDSSYY